MAGKHSVVGIGTEPKKLLDEYCYKHGVKQSSFVDKAVLEALAKSDSDALVKAQYHMRIAKDIADKRDAIKSMFSKGNFYDGYDEQQKKDMIKNLTDAGHPPNEEEKIMIDKIFDFGKRGGADIKAHLKEALEYLDSIDSEQSESQLKKRCKNKEEHIREVRKQMYNLNDLQYEGLLQVSKQERMTFGETIRFIFGECGTNAKRET